jgi:hypothetical protein
VTKSPFADHAHVEAWMEGVGPDHPIMLIVEGGWKADEMIGAMDLIIGKLEEVAPKRLAGRRRSFRNNIQGFLDNRVELNSAYQVAKSNTPFEFGKEGGNSPSEPDLSCNLDGCEVFIEVTAKSPEGIGSLHDALEAHLSDCNVYVTLNVTSILRVPQETRDATVQHIRLACSRLSSGVVTVALPEAKGSATLEKPSPFGSTSVVWMHDFGSDIGPSEEIFCEAVRTKADQALQGRWPAKTLLVIDAARLGHAVWLRGDDAWAGRLPQLDLEWETLPFLGVAMVFSTLTAAGFHGAAAPRPDLGSDELALFGELCRRLELQVA